MTKLLTYQHVSKRFGNKPILKDINLEIPRDKIIGLLGQNGAGKSTLIKLATGLLTPTTGKILFDGQPIGPLSKTDIAYLPERTYLDKNYSVVQAIKLFAEFYPNFSTEKALHLTQELGLKPEQVIRKMSKGMQEKLQLALVIGRNAKLYILDEPLGSIDPATRDFILDTILTNFADHASVLISTHLIADTERVLDEVIFLNQGKIVLVDDADRLRNQHHASIDTIFRQTFKTANSLI